MQAVYTSIFLAILCTSGIIGLKSPKPKDRNSKTKPSFFEGTQCGISKTARNSARIVGGEEATPHSWPWMVFIHCTHFNGLEEQSNGSPCGGTIISENWVATAAHCVRSPPVVDVRRDCRLGFGKHDIQQTEPTQVMDNTIAKYFIHPKYTHLTSGYIRNDLALLKLTNTLLFNHAVQPLCLPFGLGELPYNKSCYVTGWGDTIYGSSEEPGKLMQLSMMVADEPYCENRAGPDICAVTWDDNKNACHGDSGGPLACQEHDKKWYLRGVASRAQKECKFWTVFTKVAVYEDWIQLIMKKN